MADTSAIEPANTEECETFILDIIGKLLENEFTQVKDIVNDIKHEKLLHQCTWDIVPKICELLREENTCIDGFADTCEHVFLRLCDLSNVKELLLIFLEQIDRFAEHDLFVSVLKPLQLCMLRLPTRRGHSLTLVVDTLYTHIAQLPKPEVQASLSGPERALLEVDSSVAVVDTIVGRFLCFLEPFIRDCSWRNENTPPDKEKLALTRCLVKILDHPLAHFDMTTENDPKVAPPRMRTLAERVIEYLTSLVNNIGKYLLIQRRAIEEQRDSESSVKENKSSDQGEDYENDDSTMDKVPELGASVLAYLVFGEQLAVTCLPQVMTYQYWLEFNLPFINCLLTHQDWLVQEKGVLLLAHILQCVPKGSLPADFLSTYFTKLLLQSLLQLLCTGQNIEVNQAALKAFTGMFWCFEPSGRYRFLQFILKKSKHSGVRGYCATLLKELIDNNLKTAPSCGDSAHRYLTVLFKEIFTLPDGETTDLIENSAQIMSTLNLLRYLVLRDKTDENATGTWTLLPNIESNYCEKLRMGINMSRAHYQVDLEKTRNPNAAETDVDINFSIGSDAMPGLSQEQKEHALLVALNTFDMLESVLGRITELIASVKKPGVVQA